MAIFKLKLLKKEKVARDTLKFEFQKPNELTFKAGQYGGFTLINPKEVDQGGITRRFSLLSAPHEFTLSITTRIQQSAYKKILSQLEVGEEIKFAGPTGTFTLHEDSSLSAVLIAGGIGIAPFYSMIKDRCFNHSSQLIYLFYGNQTFEDAAFFDELKALATRHNNFKFIPTFVLSPSDWKGEQGFITDQMIRKYILNLSQAHYYICGSPVMVTTLQETLAEMGINEDNIKVEDFPGY